MNNLITVSPSPHVHSGKSVEKLMYGVVIALIPALAASIIMYGIGAIAVTLIAISSCVLFEFLIQKFIMKTQVRVSDGSAMVTGLLLAFNLPSNLPWWIIIIGALVAIGVGKMTFGGLGNNPFNPALVGRVFLLLSFPVQMTVYPKPTGFLTPYVSNLDGFTGPTPLSVIKEGIKAGTPVSDLMKEIPTHLDIFFGQLGGSLGEISALALLIGVIYLIVKKIISWHIPVSVVLTAFIFSGILYLVNPEKNIDPIYHLLTGGFLLGAFFMATDYVTSPMSNKGMLIYGAGIGLITIIIRVWGAYPEGMSFAILIMNAFVPLINRYIKPARFGVKK